MHERPSTPPYPLSPIEPAVGVANEHARHTRGLIALSAAFVAAASIVSTGLYIETRPTMVHAEAARAPGDDGDDQQRTKFADPTRPYCAPPTATDHEAVGAAAQECTDVKASLRIARVLFGGPQPAEEQASADVATMLRTVTGGRIQATVDTLHASAAAEDTLAAHMKGADCIDSDSSAQLPSTASMQTMELDGYDIVLAETDTPACSSDGQIAGSAYGGDRRQVDMFRADTYREHPDLANSSARNARVHEILHQIGLGHVAQAKQLWHNGMPVSLGDVMANQRGRSLDVRRFARTAQAQTYSPLELMGNAPHAFRPEERINGPQLDCLNWAGAALGYQGTLLGRHITDTPIRLNVADAAAGGYATAALRDSVELVFDDGNSMYYDHIAVIPATERGQANPQALSAVDIVLVDKTQCQVARLGEIPVTGPVTDWQLQAGSQRIRLALDSQSATIAVRS